MSNSTTSGEQIVAKWQAQWPGHSEVDAALIEHINAALAAERVKADLAIHNCMIHRRRATAFEQQLAAERKHDDEIVDVLNDCRDVIEHELGFDKLLARIDDILAKVSNCNEK